MSEAEILINKWGLDEAGDFLQNGETNDCVVRAVSVAFNIKYAHAHHFCEEKLNRKKYYGVNTNHTLSKINQAFGKKIKYLGKKQKSYESEWDSTPSSYTKILTRTQNSKIIKWSSKKQKFCKYKCKVQVPYKVKDFIKLFPVGNYIITVRRHAFAVIDGIIIGNKKDSKSLNKKVLSAFKIN